MLHLINYQALRTLWLYLRFTITRIYKKPLPICAPCRGSCTRILKVLRFLNVLQLRHTYWGSANTLSEYGLAWRSSVLQVNRARFCSGYWHVCRYKAILNCNQFMPGWRHGVHVVVGAHFAQAAQYTWIFSVSHSLPVYALIIFATGTSWSSGVLEAFIQHDPTIRKNHASKPERDIRRLHGSFICCRDMTHTK